MSNETIAATGGVAFPDAPILAVDDDEMALRLLRRILERAGYTRVVTTSDPAAAPARYAELRPDLLVLDLHMPGRSGLELIDALAPAADGVPVLVITGDESEEAARAVAARGADGPIHKPYEAASVLEAVRTLLARRLAGARTGPRLETGC